MNGPDRALSVPVIGLSGKQALVAAVGVAVLVVALCVPVWWDKLTAAASKRASKAAPRVFLLGTGVLVTGLVARVGVLDIAGACLIGAVVLAAILDNY